MIAPNSIATLDYALPCRSLLIEETTIRQIVDVSGLSPFPGVGVYPYILVWEKRPPTRRDKIEVLHARSLNGLSRRTTTLWVPQAGLSAQAGLAVHGTLDVESRVATEPLGRRARLHSGATGFAAQRLAGQLMEKGRQRFGKCFEFIVSGNIDRYQVRLGGVQFIKRKFTRPVLPAGASVLSAAKRQLYGDPKIVIAGVTRRLEAAWDGDGLALGVQVYAAAEPKDDPWLLLALLNSKLLSHLFRIRFQAKQLRGGFLAVNKGQLEKLPIRIIEDGDRDCRLLSARLAQLAAQMHRLHQRRRGAKSPDSAARLTQQIRTVDREIDQIVYQLYKLTDEEISQVEASVQTTGLSLDNSDASR